MPTRPDQAERMITDVCVCGLALPGGARDIDLRGTMAYPNPFNPSTSIAFVLDAPAQVTLRIYGADGPLGRGDHIYSWDGRDSRGRRLPSGLYFSRLDTPDGVSSGRLMMVK